MAKNAHLTFYERQTIEVSLRDNLKFKEIGELLGKDPSTISKEIRNHYKVVEARSVILLAIPTVLILRNRFA